MPNSSPQVTQQMNDLLQVVIDSIAGPISAVKKPVMTYSVPRSSPMAPQRETEVIDFINPNMKTGPWIVGGAVMSWYNNESVSFTEAERLNGVSDIDVFCANEDQFNELVAKFRKSGSLPLYTSNNAATYAYTHPSHKHLTWMVQLIRQRFYADVYAVFDRFDLRCCQIATDGRKLVAMPGTLSDIKNKNLVIANFNPATCIGRITKYMSYGYSASQETIERAYRECDFTGNSNTYENAF